MHAIDQVRTSGLPQTPAQAEPETPLVILKSYETALAEARRCLVNAEAYELRDWSCGYKEPAGGLSDAEIRMVYEFAFVPQTSPRGARRRPKLIEVPANAGPAETHRPGHGRAANSALPPE